MKRLVVFFALALALLAPATLSAAECQFVLGFKILRDLVGHEVVGDCLENEHYNATGDSVQQTTGGLLVWRKADNWTAFTDGYRTWINGPNGLEQRLNSERFEWEPDYAPGGGIATPEPTPTPIPPPDPTPSPTPTADMMVRVAAAIREIYYLPWAREGYSLNELEEEALLSLQSIAEVSPEAAVALVRRPWLRDGLNWDEYKVLTELPPVISWMDAATALQFVKMPFLHSSATWPDNSSILTALADMMTHSPNPDKREVLRAALAHPLLEGGIWDGYRTRVEFVAIGQRSPEIAAAVYSLPWIQDGMYGTEWQAITVLHEATLRAPHIIPSLVDQPWARDGLSKAEIDRVWNIMRSAHVPAPTPTPDISAEIAAAKRAISGLPWVRDNVEKPPDWGVSAFPLSSVERLRRTRHRLLIIAEHSPQVLMVLARRPWLRDGVSPPEYQIFMDLSYFAKFDTISTLRLVMMPFLQTSVDWDNASALDALDSMFAYSPNTNRQEVLRAALAHPLLRDGIKDGYRTRVEFVTIGQRSPEIAAAIYSLPWIRDGLEGSEWEAITALHHASYFEQYSLDLVTYPWVRDGLDKAEQEKVWELAREHY